MANLLSTNVTGTLNTTGNTTAAGYTGNANVGGTGAATWHPSGIYCGGTMWQYGAQYKNTTGIYDVSELTLSTGPLLLKSNNNNLIVRGYDGNAEIGILGQKSGGGFGFQIYGNGVSYGFLDGAWAGWDIRKAVDGALYMNANDTYYLRTDSTSYLYQLSVNTNVYLDNNYGSSIIGLYSDVRYQGVFAMGDAYKLALNGTDPGTLYGIAWTHSNIGGQSKAGLGHQALFMMNGRTYTAIGSGIWTDGTITTTSHGTSANWNTAYGWGNHASAGYQAAATAITTSNIASQSVSYATSAGSAPNAGNLNTSYGVTAGAGNGLKFWNGEDTYKISMGNSDEYHYGPVTDYSIKTVIDSVGATRGFTWGQNGVTPIAALNVGNGNMQIAGAFTASNFSGSSSGTNTGDQTNISGNAATATNADAVDGFHATNAASGLAYYASNGYLNVPSWINVGTTGIFSGTNNAHIRPNTASYGAWEMIGSRNGWSGIFFNDSGDYLMANNNEVGHYQNGIGWKFRWYQGQMYVSRNNTGGGTEYTVLDSGNYSSWAIARGGDTVTGIINFQTNNGGRSGATDSAKLQAYSTGNNAAFMSFHKSGVFAINFGLDDDNVMRMGGWSASPDLFQMDMSGTLTMKGDVIAFSDARVKENIQTLDGALEKTLKLRGVSYNRIDIDDKSTKIGVIAQEILEVVPEVVSQDANGTYGVSYGNIVGLLIEAIKEQQQQINNQQQQIDDLLKNLGK